MTDLPTFNQSFDSLEGFNHLSNFIVQGSSGSIVANVSQDYFFQCEYSTEDYHIQYVEADIILVRAMGSEITGTFNTSNTLILESMLA